MCTHVYMYIYTSLEAGRLPVVCDTRWTFELSPSICIYICVLYMCVCIYIYIGVCVCVCLCIRLVEGRAHQHARARSLSGSLRDAVGI